MTPLDHRFLLKHQFALINPLQVDESAWRDLPVEPVVPEAFVSQPDLMPLLLDFSQLSQTELVGLIQRAEDWLKEEGVSWFSALLKSDATAERLQKHLKKCLALPRKDEKHDLLRFYDPRVFRHFDWLLTPVQRDALLGPITRWSWSLDGTHWQSLQRQSDKPALFRITPQQKQELANLGELNACLSEWAKQQPDKQKGSKQIQQAQELLAEAANAQLQSREDCLLYALQALCFHPKIHQHPKMQALLEQQQASSKSYAFICKHLTDEDLQTFAKDLIQGTRRHHEPA